jgi:probable rRNA maturation factor
VRLELVDRRRRADDGWRGDGELWPTLVALAAPAGRSDWQAAVVLVDDDEMASLNEAYRGHADPTDVLSFSYLQPEGAGTCDLGAGEGWAACDLWSDEAGPAALEPATPGATADPAAPAAEAATVWQAGEIVLAPAFVAERCARNGWDLAAEWALLVVHGILHVLGWEHDTEPRRQRMRAAESELLARRGIRHPLGDEPAEDGWATT